MDTPAKKVGIVGGRSMGKMAAMAAIAGLAFAGGVTPIAERHALRPEAPKIESPRAASRTKRQTRKMVERQNRKARRREAVAGLHSHAQKKRGLFWIYRKEEAAIASAINAMTNWQRKQWARAGYPRDPQSVVSFSTKQRPA